VALDERGVLRLVYFTGEPQGGDIYYVRREAGKTEFTCLALRQVEASGTA
jgi:hypothetical protein